MRLTARPPASSLMASMAPLFPARHARKLPRCGHSCSGSSARRCAWTAPRSPPSARGCSYCSASPTPTPLRIFPDAAGRMNEPLGDREVLCISQFTLYGDARRGNRPSYVAAARAEHAEPLYQRVCDRLGARRGVFGAQMAVELVNDGPVTLLVEVE